MKLLNFLNKAKVGKDRNSWPHQKVQWGNGNQWDASLGWEVSKPQLEGLGL